MPVQKTQKDTFSVTARSSVIARKYDYSNECTLPRVYSQTHNSNHYSSGVLERAGDMSDDVEAEVNYCVLPWKRETLQGTSD